MLASLRLLIRICRNVSVALPSEADRLLVRSNEEIQPLTFGGPVRFDAFPRDPSSYDAILSIGSTAKPDLPWTVINSNGWLARISSGRTSLPSDCGEPNPIAAFAAASLGAGEVFKRLVRLKPSRGALLDGLSFSLFNYRSDERDPGPRMPERLDINLMVAGAGAIGNGIVYTLSKLPIVGRLDIVDKQCFGPENLGTCILIGPADVGKSKATVAAAYLSPHINVGAYRQDLDSFEARLGTELPYPNVILNGLDNINARHQVQKLWADLIIDGAIGDLSCQVSRHPWGE
ncbi:MAG: ThiF family adenylyltransferase, partial [Candidatus Marsarchaeota archaeon]|nr:ThiF family adenylyltransferase [Candidatus Marsarchaeota archaeon]